MKIKFNLFSFVLGLIVMASTCVGASLLYQAKDIEFNSDNTDKTNVQDALDEIYTEMLPYKDIKYKEIFIAHWYSYSYSVVLNAEGSFLSNTLAPVNSKYLEAKNVSYNVYSLVAKKKIHAVVNSNPGTSVDSNNIVEKVYEAGETIYVGSAGWNIMVLIDEVYE